MASASQHICNFHRVHPAVLPVGTSAGQMEIPGLGLPVYAYLERHYYLVDLEFYRAGFCFCHHYQQPPDVPSLAGLVQCSKKAGQ